MKQVLRRVAPLQEAGNAKPEKDDPVKRQTKTRKHKAKEQDNGNFLSAIFFF
jgi:hypothetical protein